MPADSASHPLLLCSCSCSVLCFFARPPLAALTLLPLYQVLQRKLTFDARSHIRLLEDAYCCQDPYTTAPRHIVLGSRCAVCNASVCVNAACSVFYTKRFCRTCVHTYQHLLPSQVVAVRADARAGGFTPPRCLTEQSAGSYDLDRAWHAPCVRKSSNGKRQHKMVDARNNIGTPKEDAMDCTAQQPKHWTSADSERTVTSTEGMGPASNHGTPSWCTIAATGRMSAPIKASPKTTHMSGLRDRNGCGAHGLRDLIRLVHTTATT